MTEPYDVYQDFVEVGGLRLHYALEGDPDKPLLALINMASSNFTSWEPVMEPLLGSFQVLRHDTRGMGKSAWGDDNGFRFSSYANDLAGLMDALHLDRAFVLGIAYGARTAARFALLHEDRLTALGLFDVALTPPVEQSGQRDLGEKARRMLAEAGLSAVMPRKSWRFYEDRAAAAKVHQAHEGEEDLSERLGHLGVPVLVACGEEDMNLEEARRIADHIPTSEFHAIPMAGHGSIYYRPDVFCDLVCDFAARRVDGAA